MTNVCCPTMGISGMAWRSMFEAWMPSSAPQMVLLTFAETKVRPAAGNDKTEAVQYI